VTRRARRRFPAEPESAALGAALQAAAVLERVPVRRYVADNPPACEPEVGALTLPYPPAQAARPLDKAAGAVDVVAAKSMQRHAHGRLRPRQVQNLCNIAVSGVTARWGCTPRLVRLPSWCKLASLTLDALHVRVMYAAQNPATRTYGWGAAAWLPAQTALESASACSAGS